MNTTPQPAQQVAPTPSPRALLNRRVRLLVAATISYNVVEAAVAVSAGVVASSTALVAFGLDSIVEVTSALAIAWQFAARDPETREKAALRIVASCFFALAAYVTVDAVLTLTLPGGDADPSRVGIVLAAVSLAVMPLLSLAQRRAGRQLGSASAVADSKQTLLCTYMSAVLLVGLALNATLGWEWADSTAALVIAAVAVKEGREAWRGDVCCAAPVTAAGQEPGNDQACGCGSSCTDACCAPGGGHPPTDGHRSVDGRGSW